MNVLFLMRSLKGGTLIFATAERKLHSFRLVINYILGVAMKNSPGQRKS